MPFTLVGMNTPSILLLVWPSCQKRLPTAARATIAESCPCLDFHLISPNIHYYLNPWVCLQPTGLRNDKVATGTLKQPLWPSSYSFGEVLLILLQLTKKCMKEPTYVQTKRREHYFTGTNAWSNLMKFKTIHSHKKYWWKSETYRTQFEEDISIRKSMRTNTIPVTPGTEQRQIKDKGHVWHHLRTVIFLHTSTHNFQREASDSSYITNRWLNNPFTCSFFYIKCCLGNRNESHSWSRWSIWGPGKKQETCSQQILSLLPTAWNPTWSAK